MKGVSTHLGGVGMLSMGAPPQKQGKEGSSPGNMFTMFGPLVIIFVIFYFLLIRPQKSQQKKLQQMLTAMRKGDSVVTRGGIHGKVAGITDNIITVEIADNVKIKMNRDAITHVSPAT